jgi:histidinol-phosphate aminotransferase
MRAAVNEKTKLVFVCDPNNPTGTRVDRDALLAFARALSPHVLLVLDQAYREFMDPDGTDGVDVLAVRPLTVVLRTASKIYGLASLRFGYGYGAPDVVAALNRVRLPFNVAGPAAAAVLAALDDDEFFARSIESNERGKKQLYAAFERLGVHAYPTAANFISVATPVAADVAYGALLERGVIVRSGDGLGMPGYLRVTVGTAEQNDAFIDAFTQLLATWRAAAPVEALR